MRQEHQQEQTEKTTLPVFVTQEVAETVAETESIVAEETAQKVEELGKALRQRVGSMRWGGAPLAGILLTLMAVVSHPSFATDSGRSILFALLAANYVWLFTLLFRGASRQNQAIKALANTDDLRVVGVMAEALQVADPTYSIAGAVLIRLLPQMRAEDAALLTPAQRKALREGLRRAASPMGLGRYNPTLAIAILHALERFGDADDLVLVERLARRKTKTAEQERIRQAAEMCLPLLRARVAGEEPMQPSLPEERLQEATQLSAEEVEALSARLKRIARLRQRNVTITAAGAIGSTVSSVASLFLANAGHATHSLLLSTMLLSGGLISIFAARGVYAQRNLTNALIHTDDLRVIGPLLEAADSSEVSGAMAAMVLTRLLPRLQASDAGLLDDNARNRLNSALLKQSRNADFVLAALKALQQVGDARALPVVQKLANRTDRSAAAQSIRAAAQECLPFLELRAAQEQASQTLLRASGVNATPPDTLLRPVQNPIQVPAEELLRPGTPRPELEGEEVSDSERTDRSASPFDAPRTLCGLSV
ncbi:MAG TPA: hypothetical protein VKU00_31335 [Chthonomonadaceae bacterium]|nr:hypothetical protein [Chthonomonadaceae bacterium]